MLGCCARRRCRRGGEQRDRREQRTRPRGARSPRACAPERERVVGDRRAPTSTPTSAMSHGAIAGATSSAASVISCSTVTTFPEIRAWNVTVRSHGMRARHEEPDRGREVAHDHHEVAAGARAGPVNSIVATTVSTKNAIGDRIEHRAPARRRLHAARQPAVEEVGRRRRADDAHLRLRRARRHEPRRERDARDGDEIGERAERAPGGHRRE